MKFLHVGCGHAKKDSVLIKNFQEWDEVRCDIDDDCDPDIVADMRTLAGVPDLDFEGVYCSHALEHLQLYDVPHCLHAFHRVLKEGGLLALIVPNFEAACRAVAEHHVGVFYDSPAGPIYPQDVIFGKQDWTLSHQHMRHQCGFTPEFLRGIVIGAGFQISAFIADDFNLVISGVKR